MVAGGGEPGGEGGISKLGTGGMVRLRTTTRSAVYGEDGAEPPFSGRSTSPLAIFRGAAAGPGAGPRAGPIGAVGRDVCTCDCGA